MALLATAPLQPWHPASSDIKEVCAKAACIAKAAKYCAEEGVDISRLAMKYSAGFREVKSREYFMYKLFCAIKFYVQKFSDKQPFTTLLLLMHL